MNNNIPLLCVRKSDTLETTQIMALSKSVLQKALVKGFGSVHRRKLSLSYTCSWCVILAAPLEKTSKQQLHLQVGQQVSHTSCKCTRVTI